MMAAWMLYTLLITLLLVIAGTGIERVMRALRAPTRFAWAGVITTVIALSALSLFGRRVSPSSVVLEQPPVRPPSPAATDTFVHGSVATIARLNAAGVGRPASSARWLIGAAALRLDEARWERYNADLMMVCLSSAVAGALVVTLSLARLRFLTRALSPGELDGAQVLVSNDLGPAVVGFASPRVVIPRWVSLLSFDERRTILLHEQEHVAARDPMLLLAGAVALALQPWNVPLWIAVARLRFTIEADCDARVLARSRCGARPYGAILLHVHELTSAIGSSTPVPAFVDSTSHLERRVRRMTDRQPRVRSLSTLLAALLIVVAAGMTLSVRVSRAREATRTVQALRPEANAMPSAVRVVAPVVADSESSPDLESDIPHLRRNTLPGLSNSERAPVQALRVTLSSTPATARGAGIVDRSAVQQAFVPETLFLQSSNPSWPMKARITFSGPGAEQVVVTNEAGHTLPIADTLIVEGGPVQLVLPEVPFRLNFESLAGDLSITTSPTLDMVGKGRWVGTMLGRSMLVLRDTTDAPVKFRANGAGFMKGQRIR